MKLELESVSADIRRGYLVVNTLGPKPFAHTYFALTESSALTISLPIWLRFLLPSTKQK